MAFTFILCNTNYFIKNKILFTSIQFMDMLVYVVMHNKCNLTFKINIGTYKFFVDFNERHLYNIYNIIL